MITILVLLTGVAVPNIISTINNNKRDTFLLDANRMVAKAKSFIASNRQDRNTIQSGTPIVYTFSELNEKSEFSMDADGGKYDDSSYIKVSILENKENPEEDTYEINYCVCIIGSKRRISGETTCDQHATDNCISSEKLTGIDIVKDNE